MYDADPMPTEIFLKTICTLKATFALRDNFVEYNAQIMEYRESV